ncbi:hypothetical protein JAAARDRAFT_27874 [Jaapia argillacea MUCL 33604]|uniref:Uncharacterized protein n=1 Tax=Jaapia argillacea MUCL 33604 TaxID=933084 RepID=A0A067QB09_9AGAM|nr:hypothetical protein JAAARDRAFT_27874 [Jaapia argillacea MUCL 33604]
MCKRIGVGCHHIYAFCKSPTTDDSWAVQIFSVPPTIIRSNPSFAHSQLHPAPALGRFAQYLSTSSVS